MIIKTEDLQTASKGPVAILQNPPSQPAASSVHSDRDAAGHSPRSQSAHLGAGGVPSGQCVEAASRGAKPDLTEGLPGDGPKRARRAAPEESAPVNSMLDFGQDRMGLHVGQNGLSFPDEMPFDSWCELGWRVALVANCSAWWLGDWLLYGEQAYGDRYQQAIADTSLGYQTLRNYAWVARKFPMSRRRDTLSFGHHAEVAALLDDEQDAWLAQAEQSNWSRNQLRRELRAAKVVSSRASRDEGSVNTRALKIDVPAERHNRWESAAKQNNSSLAEWIITALDRAASQEPNI